MIGLDLAAENEDEDYFQDAFELPEVEIKFEDQVDKIKNFKICNCQTQTFLKTKTITIACCSQLQTRTTKITLFSSYESFNEA